MVVFSSKIISLRILVMPQIKALFSSKPLLGGGGHYHYLLSIDVLNFFRVYSDYGTFVPHVHFVCLPF